MKELLNRNQLPAAQAGAGPVTVLQIGEGNFLRGFVDWMIHECRRQGLYEGSIAVSQPRPSGKKKLDALRAQDGLYTLVTRGMELGKQVERSEIISVFSEMIDPYEQWQAFLQIAERPELQVIVSNTTEAGLSYQPEELREGEPVASFPGKITLLLYRRYKTFNGAADAGLLLLPCELLERNGDELQRCVLQYCADWQLPEAFREWVVRHNRFLNSLVDRIVTGYPDDEAEAWFEEWGYRDALLNTAEPYHFWAIEGEPALDDILPFRKAGLNVQWVEKLQPYQLRKVRILNGAHTLMTPLGILLGKEQVREVMEDEQLGAFIRDTVEQDIIPQLPLPAEQLRAYAADVFERFRNPYIRHRLSDIAMNSLSKFTVRLLPAIAAYLDQGAPVPERLVRGFAGLLRYYKVEQAADGGYYGSALQGGASYQVKDDAAAIERLRSAWHEAFACSGAAAPDYRVAAEKLLGCSEVWGRDLAAEAGLVAAVADQLAALEKEMTR
ncbi:tagaturonate reductase [Paenibacillus sp. GCM10027626]|uniref:tagaturonate reductase n=1 Tax=Paenibacillus sp. GCM10027626 TaxID=3273411 RepID=UPI00363398AC